MEAISSPPARLSRRRGAKTYGSFSQLSPNNQQHTPTSQGEVGENVLTLSILQLHWQFRSLQLKVLATSSCELASLRPLSRNVEEYESTTDEQSHT